MIRIGFTEIALFLAPFVLYAVFLWATKAGMMDAESWPCSRFVWLAIGALLLVVGSFVYVARFHRRAARIDLCAGAYRERQIRAGGDPMTSGATSRSLADESWLNAGRAATPARRARSRRRGGARSRRRGAQRADWFAGRGDRRRHYGGAGRGGQARFRRRLQAGGDRHRARHGHRRHRQAPVRGDVVAPGRGNLRTPRQGCLRARLADRRRAARFHHQRIVGRARRHGLRLCRRTRRSEPSACALHRQSATADRGRLSAHPAFLPFPRRL